MGGSKQTQCNMITREICLSLACLENTVADRESRLNHDDTEWQLNPKLFRKLGQVQLKSETDLSASRINLHILPYVVWKPDPGAVAIDAFSIPWNQYFYAFPPLCLIGKQLAKIGEEKADGILIVLLWTTQL